MKKREEVREWFFEARFGIFIHFGLYALCGGNENDYKKGIISKEDYENMMNYFNPVGFNADEWVELIKKSGAKYLVITSKHGEGFCLWDTKTTYYKITNTPFKRDIIKELSESCHRKNLKFGIYFSCTDWHYDEKKAKVSYPEYVEAQITELINNYGEVSEFWFDGYDKRLGNPFTKRMVSLIHKVQPTAVVNDRGVKEIEKCYGDFFTPERYIPDEIGKNVFIECCDAMGQKSWGYNKNQIFWSTSELLQRLSKSSSLGGNYLLNIEPRPDGKIREECVERMLEIGEWLKVNGEGIYGSEGCILFPVDFFHSDVSDSPYSRIGYATKKGSTVYIHIHRFPKGDAVLVPYCEGEISKVEILGIKRDISYEKSEDGLILKNLPDSWSSNPMIIKVVFKKEPEIAVWKLNNEKRKVVKVLKGETVYLTPEKAERKSKSGVPLHRINYFSNGRISIGHLYCMDAEIIWNLDVEKEGFYKVYAEIGANELQKDATFLIEVGKQKLSGKTVFTGGYDIPVRMEIGEVKLLKGRQKCRLKILEMPHGYFGDVHNIVFQPKILERG